VGVGVLACASVQGFSSRARERLNASEVGVVVEPRTDDDRPELRLGLETERLYSCCASFV
jgi:hypothetical protein